MANLYVRSTDGLDADNGTTWALAKAKLSGADAIDAAGDAIYVSQVHAESTAGAIVLAFAGTAAAPTRILCGNDGAAPPTALATTATVSKTAAGNFTIGGNLYAYGLTFQITTASGSGEALLLGTSANDIQTYENCKFYLHTGATQFVSFGNYGSIGQLITWKNCNVKMQAVGQNLYATSSFRWNGGQLEPGSTVSNLLVTDITGAPGSGGKILIENVDLSALGTTSNIVQSGSVLSPWEILIRNCKLPASWTGTLATSAGLGGRAVMVNCASDTKNYRMWVIERCGSIVEEATIVRTGGASDGVTPISWKMVTLSIPVYPHFCLASQEIFAYCSTTGSAQTLTVEILRDSVTNLKDNEVWLEVNYLGSSATPQGTLITDAAASVLATAADQTASAVTWTTTGLTNPNKQALAVTLTPQMKGFYVCRVMLAKPSVTVYVDPRVTVT